MVEDNASPHNNQTTRDSHGANNVRIVGYEVTPAQKEGIRELIRVQTTGYTREQDRDSEEEDTINDIFVG